MPIYHFYVEDDDDNVTIGNAKVDSLDHDIIIDALKHAHYSSSGYSNWRDTKRNLPRIMQISFTIGH
jgi:hypothetical protein